MTIAIVKPIKVRTGNLAGLRAVIAYIKADVKTQNGELVYCKDMLKGKELEQMLITKNIHHKSTGRQYAHFIQSFDVDDPVTPQMAFEIGQEFLKRNEKFNDFQVVFGVHTNEKHMHIHYVINSVSTEKGEKWQCSPKDLEHMRSISDELCKEHGLSVIENRGNFNTKYGEYKAHKSWKQQLAIDIANSVKESFTTLDFYHNLQVKGIDCSFGDKNIMFKVCEGYCGLKGERLCSNYKLMPYGDFCRDNILNSINYNEFNLQDGLSDVNFLQGFLLELGRLDFPEDPYTHERSYLNDLEFKGRSKLEIEGMIAAEKAKQRNEEITKLLQDRQKQNAISSQMLATSLGGLCEEFAYWKQKQEYERYNSYNDQSQEQEYDDWEL